MEEFSPLRLAPLGQRILKHWKQHRPKMTADLLATGELRKAVYAAQELTLQAQTELWKMGIGHKEAEEMTLEQWALLPDEETMPQLNQNPREWISLVPTETTD
jgi:hypothetical protein